VAKSLEVICIMRQEHTSVSTWQLLVNACEVVVEVVAGGCVYSGCVAVLVVEEISCSKGTAEELADHLHAMTIADMATVGSYSVWLAACLWLFEPQSGEANTLSMRNL
jgi:hypothetical protein